MTEPPPSFDVFLSHGSPDKVWVRTLVEQLEAAGLKVFLDEADLRPAENFVVGLNAGLEESSALVLVLSAETISRPWVEREWTAFMAEHGLQRRILPVLLEDLVLPAFLKPIQSIDARDRDAERVAELLAYGPIADELSTRAEEALYASIAAGETTRMAIRRARRAMQVSFDEAGAGHKIEVQALDSSSVRAEATAPPNRSHPFAWAQLVCYHRGPDLPLSIAVNKEVLHQREQVLKRSFTNFGDRRMLATGFIGRRTELHSIRKRIRDGYDLFVLQGLGGLGKTTLAGQMLKMLAPEDWACTIWCQEVEEEADPVEAMVGQLLKFCRKRFGAAWEQIVSLVDRNAQDDSVLRFASFLHEAAAHCPERMVLYLDNLESLLVGPSKANGEAPPIPDEFGSWKSDDLEQFWARVTELSEGSDKLRTVASCRYRNKDFEAVRIPVARLPSDALFRLMPWFPSLRRLSSIGRARLVDRLGGHPRAVEFIHDLIRDRLLRWEEGSGSWLTPDASNADRLEREWDEIIAPALPDVQELLWTDLLLKSIWETILGEGERRMLFRMILLRRPWDLELIVSGRAG